MTLQVKKSKKTKYLNVKVYLYIIMGILLLLKSKDICCIQPLFLEKFLTNIFIKIQSFKVGNTNTHIQIIHNIKCAFMRKKPYVNTIIKY